MKSVFETQRFTERPVNFLGVEDNHFLFERSSTLRDTSKQKASGKTLLKFFSS